MIRRFLPLPALGFLVLTACDGGTAVSPMAPEVPDPSLTRVAAPSTEALAFEPPTSCPAPACLFEPIIFSRGPDLVSLSGTSSAKTQNGSRRNVVTFGSNGLEEADLVVMVSDPKTTTVKAWMNGTMVLLPSAVPQSGSDRVSVRVELEEENELEVRLTAKPGNLVAFWMEGGDEGPTEPPPPTTGPVFTVTDGAVGPGAVTDGLCGTGFRVADWTDVVDAVNAGLDTGVIGALLDGAQAFLRYETAGTFNGMFGILYHYTIAGSSPGDHNAAIGTDLYLRSSSGDQPVLCVEVPD